MLIPGSQVIESCLISSFLQQSPVFQCFLLTKTRRKKSLCTVICCEPVSWILRDNKKVLQRTSLSFKDGQYPSRREGNRVNYHAFKICRLSFATPFTPYITSQLLLLTIMRTSRYRNVGRLMTRG